MHHLDRRDVVKASSLAFAGFPFVGRAAGEDSKSYRACVIDYTGRGGYGHGTHFQDARTCLPSHGGTLRQALTRSRV